MSDGLKQFYREIWAWIQDGFPEHEVFRQDRALCAALALWGEMNFSRHIGLCRVLNDQFAALGCAVFYPFNQGYDDWKNERKRGELYLNAERLAFIEEHAK